MIVENEPNNAKDLINIRRIIYKHFRHKTDDFNANNENNTLNLYTSKAIDYFRKDCQCI
jgi:hypothetical protein